MKLKQLVEVLPAASVEGSLDGEVTGIAYDSRRVTPGMLFVAIPGQHADGHEFIANAVERGAADDTGVARSAADDGANGESRLQSVRNGSEFARVGTETRDGCGVRCGDFH